MEKKHKSALLVTLDRTTLLTTIDKLNAKNSDVITQKMIDRSKKFPTSKTMTFDNDQDFSQHEKIAKTLK
jgi:IS30 family transposase